MFHSVRKELNFFPEIDVFASRLNNKCEFSEAHDPFCMGVDTFINNAGKR